MVVPAAHPFRIRAVNAPQHARNPIHTDEGARAAGFPAALVAGVTTYAYLTVPLVAMWGRPWLGSGTAQVRFRSPVFADDDLVCTPSVAEGETGFEARVIATVGDDPEPRAVVSAGLDGPEAAPLRQGEPLRSVEFVLEGEWGAGYGAAVGDPSDAVERLGVVHPAVWPALANHIVHEQVARGSWVHVRSAIIHHATVPVGSIAVVRSTVVGRFQRSGERAVLDLRIEVDGVAAVSIEHEAIIAMAGA